MQFKVPQFLEIEDKIFGPFTFKEFVYLVGGGGICFILYRLLGIWIGAVPILIVGSLAGMLTFYKPNNKPFIFMLQSMIKYLFQDKLYIWERRKETISEKSKDAKLNQILSHVENNGKLNNSKLRDLAWSLDVLDLTKQK